VSFVVTTCPKFGHSVFEYSYAGWLVLVGPHYFDTTVLASRFERRESWVTPQNV
jgi:hypothetical protein